MNYKSRKAAQSAGVCVFRKKLGSSGTKEEAFSTTASADDKAANVAVCECNVSDACSSAN